MQSLNRNASILGLFIYIVLSNITIANLYAEGMPEYIADEAIVTASRSPMAGADLTRHVRVIGRREIDRLPVSTVQDLLGYIAGVDLQQRSPNGVQADLSIRGASFEQTLVLIDGIRIADPQTGHHMLNLPVTLAEIERVEVLYGHSSRLFGSSAVGGVVNIITRQPESNGYRASIEAGDFELGGVSLGARLVSGNFRQSLSLERLSTGAYVPSSESEALAGTYRVKGKVGGHSPGLMLGFQNKRFGASTFYTNLFPNEWEATETRFLGLSDEFGFAGWNFQTRLSYREHDDEFILDRFRTNFSRSVHTNRTTGGEILAGKDWSWGATWLSAEVTEETLESSSLGDRRRGHSVFSLEHRLATSGGWDLTGGAAVAKYDGRSARIEPGIDAGFNPTANLRIFSSFSTAFRAPTFTELYYNAPGNIGDPNLEPEESQSYEAGVRWIGPYARMTATYFHRTGENVIDWVRVTPTDSWRVRNIGSLSTDGMELMLEGMGLFPLVARTWEFGGTVNSNAKDLPGLTSKYALAYPKVQMKLGLVQSLPFDVESNWIVRYKERPGRAGYFVTDLSIQRSFGKFQTRVAINNLFDLTYEEVAFVSMPGRWARIALTYEVN